jgi:hypothetical protein
MDLSRHGVLTRELFGEMTTSVVLEAETAFKNLLGNAASKPDDPRESQEKTRSLLRKIRENWSALRPKLDKLKRGGDLLP